MTCHGSGHFTQIATDFSAFPVTVVRSHSSSAVVPRISSQSACLAGSAMAHIYPHWSWISSLSVEMGCRVVLCACLDQACFRVSQMFDIVTNQDYEPSWKKSRKKNVVIRVLFLVTHWDIQKTRTRDRNVTICGTFCSLEMPLRSPDIGERNTFFLPKRATSNS